MAGAGKKEKWMNRLGAGGWAMIGALALLCLLFMYSQKEDDPVKTDMEARMERLLSKAEGAGKTSVMINEEDGKVTGVLIVSEGAENISVRLRIQEAARALLNVDNERVHVIPMEDEGK